MATATYIGVLSLSLEVDPTAPLLCVGEGLGVQFKLPVTVTVKLSVMVGGSTSSDRGAMHAWPYSAAYAACL